MATILITLHVIACVIVIVLVLLQSGRGTGLGTAFGSDSSTQSLFGPKTADILLKGTCIFATMFVITSILLAVVFSKRSVSVMDRYPIEAAKAPLTQEAKKKLGDVTKKAQDLLKKVAPSKKEETIPDVVDTPADKTADAE